MKSSFLEFASRRRVEPIGATHRLRGRKNIEPINIVNQPKSIELTFQI